MDETARMTEGRFGLQAHIQIFGIVLLSFNSRKTSVFGKQARFQIGTVEWHEGYSDYDRRRSHGMIIWRRLDGKIRKSWDLINRAERRRIKEWKKNNP